METLETSISTAPEDADANASDATSDEESRVIGLVGFLVQGLVSHPDDVEVEEFFDSAGVVYGVRVHPDDVGRVIGREGRVVGALRNLAKASATKVGSHVTVEVLTDEA